MADVPLTRIGRDTQALIDRIAAWNLAHDAEHREWQEQVLRDTMALQAQESFASIRQARARADRAPGEWQEEFGK